MVDLLHHTLPPSLPLFSSLLHPAPSPCTLPLAPFHLVVGGGGGRCITLHGGRWWWVAVGKGSGALVLGLITLWWVFPLGPLFCPATGWVSVTSPQNGGGGLGLWSVPWATILWSSGPRFFGHMRFAVVWNV